VFSRWLDPFQYTLAPGGAFESSSGLTLAGGARIVAGNESSYVHSATDRNSVLIPSGGTVTTGPICIGIDKPTVRFFARHLGERAARARRHHDDALPPAGGHG
jgi:hypothetical protein